MHRCSLLLAVVCVNKNVNNLVVTYYQKQVISIFINSLLATENRGSIGVTSVCMSLRETAGSEPICSLVERQFDKNDD